MRILILEHPEAASQRTAIWKQNHNANGAWSNENTWKSRMTSKTSNVSFSGLSRRNCMKLGVSCAKFNACPNWHHPGIQKHCSKYDLTTKPWTYPKIVLLWRPWVRSIFLQTNFLAHREVKAGSAYGFSIPLKPDIKNWQVGWRLKLRFSMPKVHLCPSPPQRQLPRDDVLLLAGAPSLQVTYGSNWGFAYAKL